MKRDDLTNFAKRLKGIFEEGRLNELGRQTGLCRRLRVITPQRLGLLLVSLFLSRRVETIADIQRGFVALFGEGVEYKPFHNQLRKPGFADFMRELVTVLLNRVTMKVLRPARGSLLAQFRRVVIQDGSSFALKDGLRKIFPGRFHTVSPAAVELHVTYDLLEESAAQVALRPDADSEHLELPEAAEMKGALFLGDRGYVNLPYFAALMENSGSFIVRGKTSLNPEITAAYSEGGRRKKRFVGRSLKKARGFSRSSLADLDVCWDNVQGQPLKLRMVVFWSPKEQRHSFLITNLARADFSAREVLDLYALRWQVELYFKEWKSYANLRAFDTEQAAIAEGLIWSAIAASICKRFFAHAAQLLTQVEISTRKVAMCLPLVVDDVFSAIAARKLKALVRAFGSTISYLAENAKRSHPERDRATGRLACGLEPVFRCA